MYTKCRIWIFQLLLPECILNNSHLGDGRHLRRNVHHVQPGATERSTPDVHRSSVESQHGGLDRGAIKEDVEAVDLSAHLALKTDSNDGSSYRACMASTIMHGVKICMEINYDGSGFHRTRTM